MTAILGPLIASLMKGKGSSARYESMPQIGDMTLEQYMEYRNPDNKLHEQGSYKADWKGFNDPLRGAYEPNLHLMERIGTYQTSKYNRVPVYKLKTEPNTYIVTEDISTRWDKKEEIVRVLIKDGVLVYDNFDVGQEFKYKDSLWYRKPHEQGYEKIPYNKAYETKYLNERVNREMFDIPAFYKERYPFVLKSFNKSGMNFEIRAKQQPRMHKNDTLVILDENGYKIGAAQDEWGATLILVAKEFRGHGISKELLKEWMKLNPNSHSGGVTSSGYYTSRSLWKDRVLELQKEGHYQQYQDQKRAKIILTEAKSLVKPKKTRKSLREPEEPVQLMAHMFGDTNVIFYDAKLLEIDSETQTLDTDLIYGYILFRENEYGTFIYQIDYDNRFRKFVTLAGFQFAKDMGYQIYYPQEQTKMYLSFLDVVEAQGIEQVERQGEHVLIKQDIIPLKDMFQIDRMQIRKAFPKRWLRDTFLTNLQEQAYGKWHSRNNRSNVF